MLILDCRFKPGLERASLLLARRPGSGVDQGQTGIFDPPLMSPRAYAKSPMRQVPYFEVGWDSLKPGSIPSRRAC